MNDRPGKKPWEEMRMFDMDDVPETAKVKVAALEQWWMEHAAEEASQTIVKAVEYGSSSLSHVGEALQSVAENLRAVSSHEAAITFYVFGKMARIIAALERGDQPSMDNWVDIGVYAKMLAYVREHGSWV